MAVDPKLLERIAASLRTSRASLIADAEPASADAGVVSARRADGDASKDSILARAAQLYGARPNEEQTPPTGFDPAAAALFEAIVEGAFLVAHADGEFDADERAAFEQVVLAATDQRIGPPQLAALLADLDQQLSGDGMDKRLDAVSRFVVKPEQQREVLRVAALIANISGGVSDVERQAMDRLGRGFGLDAGAVATAIAEAKSVLAAG